MIEIEAEHKFQINHVAEMRSVLVIGDGDPPLFLIESTHPLPNPWQRFWYWALLGWKWRRA